MTGELRCARCDSLVQQDGIVEADSEDFRAGDPVWMDDGCYVCEEYVGHDEFGRFAPTHEVDPRRAEDYNTKYGVHYDFGHGDCPYCQEHYRKERERDDVEFVCNFFRAKLGYEGDDAWELARALVTNLEAH